MTRSIPASVPVLLLAVQCVSAAPASRPAASQPAAPRILCDQPVFKLRGVWSGDKVEHKFIVQNVGAADLQIVSVEAACGCFVAEDYPKTISPNQKGAISVSLQTARGAKEVHKEMQIETNDPDRPRTLLAIAGPLTPRIEVEPIFGANWGRLYPGADLTRIVKLTNHYTAPMKLELVRPETHADYRVELNEVEKGQRAELKVQAAKDLPEGAHMQFVYLKTGFKDEPELMVPCTLYVPPIFEATPIAFSVFSKPGDVDRQTLQLRWNGEKPMRLKTATPADNLIHTTLTEQEPGRVYQLVVTIPPDYHPQATGEVQIAIATDSSDRPELNVTIRPRTLAPLASRAAG